ncbi:hypothetical protein ABZ863_15765 [Saccharomonospora sp. NPDC046836]|uniref:hypothetical protein n=1 Tax=Saccharomonospora sp. NPDC046836 TaxID=3156921 RepID=UPI0033E58490
MSLTAGEPECGHGLSAIVVRIEQSRQAQVNDEQRFQLQLLAYCGIVVAGGPLLA